MNIKPQEAFQHVLFTVPILWFYQKLSNTLWMDLLITNVPLESWPSLDAVMSPGHISSCYYEWLANRKCLSISIPYRLLSGLHSWLFVRCFETNETLCSGSTSKYNQVEIMIFWAVSISRNKIAFRFLLKELGHNLTWCVVWKGIFCGGRKVLSTTFHLLCDTGLETVWKGLWSWQMGKWALVCSDWTYSGHFQEERAKKKKKHFWNESRACSQTARWFRNDRFECVYVVLQVYFYIYRAFNCVCVCVRKTKHSINIMRGAVLT